MGQITTAFATAMLAHCQRKDRPPLTIWETEQLLRAWLELDRLRGPILAAEEIDRQFRALVVENQRLRTAGASLLACAAQLDYLVHQDRGVGRYEEDEAITAARVVFVSASPSAGTEQATAPKPTD